VKAAAIIASFNHWHNEDKQDGSWAREFAHRLQEKNPALKVLVIDNASATPYTSASISITSNKLIPLMPFE